MVDAGRDGSTEEECGDDDGGVPALFTLGAVPGGGGAVVGEGDGCGVVVWWALVCGGALVDVGFGDGVSFFVVGGGAE
jgi:hypothetical protein